MGGWLRLSRWGRALRDAATPQASWGRLLYTSLLVALVDTIGKGVFTFLFPTLSGVIGETVTRMLPLTFYSAGIFLSGLAAFVLLLALRAAVQPGSVGTSRPAAGATLLVIAILLGTAGIAVLDARLAGSAARPPSRIDR